MRTACAVVSAFIATAAFAQEAHYTVAVEGVATPVGMYERGLRTIRVHGEALATGETPDASAQQFAAIFDAAFGGPQLDAFSVQPVKYDQTTGDYAFTLLTARQLVGDVPVFGASLRVLVRNVEGYPVVWANPQTLRPIDVAEIHVDLDAAAERGLGVAHRLGADAILEMPEAVIWAGIGDVDEAPRAAVVFEAAAGSAEPGTPRWRFVTDAATGAVLHRESLVLHVDVTGTVVGHATEGLGADVCGPESPVGMPYARVSIGADVAYADEGGTFVIPHDGTDPVTVESGVRGQWFRVFNEGGADTILMQEVTPPGPADFVHNEANSSGLVRAEVNAYVQANLIRNRVLAMNPVYPVIHSETEFAILVNRPITCNAFYDGSSISFGIAQGPCPNTAYSTIVHHEYGHHIIASGGSGQGEYGEGMADAFGVLMTDDPGLAYGFLGDCNMPIRSADNVCQYDEIACGTCGSDIYSCGQVLSGAIWSTRNELIVTEPSDYLDILTNLTVNSILLHAGTSIDPSITMDFLVLDDDDGNLGNGTPHFDEINTGFAAHNLALPSLPCPGDVDGDGMVAVTDLLEILAFWGPCPGGCEADIDMDGMVEVDDLLVVLANFGPCP